MKKNNSDRAANVQTIPFRIFKRIYSVEMVDLVKSGLFTWSDLYELRCFERGQVDAKRRFRQLKSYFFFIINNPSFISYFILPRLLKRFIPKDQKLQKSLEEAHPISNNILKASISRAFNPKVILEIGTYLGWGAASFKAANPECVVYTMNPKGGKDSDNPIKSEHVGYFYKKKSLDIKQIWADSVHFDYSKIPRVDVAYIDGNHKYEYVYRDLENAEKITKRCIILDDYIPKEDRGSLIFGPWNESVVRATNDFLKSNQDIFKKAYWIKDTQLCVLVR